MTVPVAGAAIVGPDRQSHLGRWQQVLADALEQNLA
jgi:hypothetical protein